MSDKKIIEANIEHVRLRIDRACKRAGRKPADVQLLLATKTVPPERVAIALETGCRLLGENKVQEFRSKAEPLQSFSYERHFIGHLQSNKVNEVLNYVSCIHSVDSLHLAEKLDKRLDTLGRQLDVFVQVNTSYEESKFGIPPHAAEALVRQVATLKNLRIRGLMTIGKLFATGDRARQCFAALRQVRDSIQELGIAGVDLHHLSMGMTPDFEEAIYEGATIVRVGAAIFGVRPTPDGFFWNEQDREGLQGL
ncbi:YggS family pyridoxal phosphate-dependent enzyme [Ensifer sp. YR511]|uniref:YggS family pyridoxal phosphate-dependent enzyme n=1 Tax=Ensifer sp. YR511 TaxID=1855294 RepID=UPI00088E2BD2|nr:YggS family pyridoxal phosphate-dependent enzyme [Ensifer sp. YR511]SDN39590.1 hypothetical protein SAMN05216328_12565 [Ensifer sp. YR511]